MITNVSFLQRPLYAAFQRGRDGAAQGTGPAGADGETSASTDGNAATQDYKGAKDGTGAKGIKGTWGDKDAGGDGEKRDASGLTEGERKQLKELKARDTEVRNHENAHKASGGQLAGSPSYTYQTGPDGQRYAIGGEVSIDVSPEDDPAATIAKMERVSRAATSPAEPSPQDFKVAAAARRMMAEAQRDLDAAKLEEMQGGGDSAKGAAKETAGKENAGSSATDPAGQGGKAGKAGEPSPEDGKSGEKGQAKASSAAAVATAMQAYQSAAALVRSSRTQSAINA
jgi:hypothetical protein